MLFGRKVLEASGHPVTELSLASKGIADTSQRRGLPTTTRTTLPYLGRNIGLQDHLGPIQQEKAWNLVLEGFLLFGFIFLFGFFGGSGVGVGDNSSA